MNSVPAFLLLLLLLCVSLRPVNANAITAPEDGIYILTTIADPEVFYLVMEVYVNNGFWFRSIAHHGCVAGFDAAVPLKKWDNVTLKIFHPSSGNKLGVVYASTDRTHAYKTALCLGWDGAYEEYVGFQRLLNPDQQFQPPPRSKNVHQFTLQYTGIYWVMLRIDCQPDSWAVVEFEGMFKAQCKKGALTSVSGAFHMQANKKVGMKYLWGTSNMDVETVLSFVHLEGNNATAVGEDHLYMAYTAFTGSFVRYETVMSVDGTVFTDYGSMYDTSNKKVNIKVSGTYVVAVRGVPSGEHSMRVDLYKNQKVVFAFFAQNGHQSGQTGVFHFEEGDSLHMQAEAEWPASTYLVNEDTLFSIAFAWKKP